MSVEISVRMEGASQLPTYKTVGSAGADVSSVEEVTILPMQRALIRTGLFMEIPQGYEVQVRPRSGLAFHNGVTVLNAPGTIDSDYRGELKVLLVNLGGEPFRIVPGDRIAQIIVAPVTMATFVPSEALSSTERGAGGFGHTGRQ